MKKAVLLVMFFLLYLGIRGQAPTNLNAGLVNGQFKLTWEAVEGAAHYHVYHREATMAFRLIAETEGTQYAGDDYWPCLDNSYFVVSCFADGLEYASDTVTFGYQAPDFTAMDCHGHEIHLYDILGRGQYVFLDFFHYTCGPCREQVPFIVESYYYYGCNRKDVYYLEVSHIDNDDRCLQWCEEFGVEYPTISKDGGGDMVQIKYHTQFDPFVMLIAPDHSIVLNSWADSFGFEGINSLQSIVDAFDPFVIEHHQCYACIADDDMTALSLFPNPADGFVNLSLEVSGVVRVYNALGQMVDSFVAESGQTCLVTENYPNGLYYVQVNGHGAARFVVKH